MMPSLTDLTENSKKREQKISPRYGGQQVREVYIDFLSWGKSRTKEKWIPESTRGWHNPLGHARHAWHALVYRAHQGHFPGSFLFS